MRPAALLGALALVAPVAAGCSPDEPGPAAPDVTADVLQYRRDEADRMIEVKVRNGGDAPVSVSRVSLDAAAFDGPGEVEVSADVGPGRAVDLRLPYGEPDCDREPGDGDVVARLLVDGEPLELGTESGAEVLGRIHRRECAVAAATERAPMTWYPAWQRSGAGPTLVVDGLLSIGPVTGNEAVRVTEVTGTTLFTATADGLPVTVPVGQSRHVPVRFGPQRCDPHAVAESKRGYAFGVRVLTDPKAPADDAGALVAVVPDQAGQDALLAALLERCGLVGS